MRDPRTDLSWKDGDIAAVNPQTLAVAPPPASSPAAALHHASLPPPPPDYSLRRIVLDSSRASAQAGNNSRTALAKLSPLFDKMYSAVGGRRFHPSDFWRLRC